MLTPKRSTCRTTRIPNISQIKFAPSKYVEFKEYNKKLSEYNLPVVCVTEVNNNTDTITYYLETKGESTSCKYSLFATLCKYFSRPKFQFSDTRRFIKLQFDELYALLKPDEARTKLEEFANGLYTIGISDIKIGRLSIQQTENGWKLTGLASDANVKVLYLPKFIDEIDKEVFWSNNVIKAITIYSNTLKVGPSAFLNCKSIEEFNFEGIITGLGESSFEGSSVLKTVRLGSEVKEIPYRAFYGSQLTDIKFEPDSQLEKIADAAFANCDNLSKVSFNRHKKLEFIGYYAFGKCTALTEVVFKDTPSLKTLNKAVFSGCFALTALSFTGAGKLKCIPCDLCCDDYSLREVIFPTSLRVIEACAFRDCWSLKHIDLSKTDICEILDKAFLNANVDTVKVPARKTASKPLSIGKYAFQSEYWHAHREPKILEV